MKVRNYHCGTSHYLDKLNGPSIQSGQTHKGHLPPKWTLPTTELLNTNSGSFVPSDPQGEAGKTEHFCEDFPHYDQFGEGIAKSLFQFF